MTSSFLRLVWVGFYRLIHKWYGWTGLALVGPLIIVLQYMDRYGSGDLTFTSKATELFTTAWEGPMPSASILQILFWMITPVLFLIVIGEPWSSFSKSWQYGIWSRATNRFWVWTSQVTALYLGAILATILLIGSSAVTAVLIGGPFGEIFNQYAAFHTIDVLPSIALIICFILMTNISVFSLLVSIVNGRPGWTITITFIIGYVITIIETSNFGAERWFPVVNNNMLYIMSSNFRIAHYLLDSAIQNITYGLGCFFLSWFPIRRRLL